MEKSISLFFKEGTSDKEYHAQLVPSGDNYVVNFQYGRRGSALKGGTKTKDPLPEDKANKIYESLVKEKLREGYNPGESGTDFVAPAQKDILVLPQLLNPIDDPTTYINDDNYIAQEKFDGDRRLLMSSDAGITGVNRKGQSVPLPVTIADSVSKNMVLDGEIIGNKLYAFDILSIDDEDTKKLTCIQRISLLNSSLGLGKGIVVVKTAFTKAEKQALYEELLDRKAEGIVFKLKTSLYTAGRPNSGGSQLKFKFYKSATCIVKDFTSGKRSVGLELMDESGNRVFVGKVTIPPNQDVPEIGDLVEVRYLYAFKGGSIFQPVYLGKRTDLYIEDAVVSQLIYKADGPE